MDAGGLAYNIKDHGRMEWAFLDYLLGNFRVVCLQGYDLLDEEKKTGFSPTFNSEVVLPKKKRAIQARHRARELAVQLLCSLEIRPEQNLDECLDVFIKCGFASDADMGEDVKDYMSFLVREVWCTRPDIDDIMRRVVTGWRPERMVAVDRAVLRVAIFEGFLRKEVPVAVAISEAVDMARTFGTEDSSRFVNGVLAKVLQFMEDGEKTTARTDCNDKSHAASASEDSTDG